MTTEKPSPRKPTLEEALDVLEALHGRPASAERSVDPLLDHLLVAVLSTAMAETQARSAVRALSEAFLDMNEARSSPLSELEEVLAPFLPPERRREVAALVRTALQDVWDGAHGLDLEPLRSREPEDQRTFLRDLPNTLGGPAAFVFQYALGEDALSLGPRERHLLSRFGMLPRASTPQAVRQAMERRIPPGQRLRFAWLAGAASHAWEQEWDATHPFCRLLVDLRAKEVGERERARKRDELRRKVEEKRRAVEAERRRKAEAKARLAREKAEEKKRREQERKAKEAAAKEAARRLAEEKAQQKKAALLAEKAQRIAAAAEAKAAAEAARRAAAAARAEAAAKVAAAKTAAKAAAKAPAPGKAPPPGKAPAPGKAPVPAKAPAGPAAKKPSPGKAAPEKPGKKPVPVPNAPPKKPAPGKAAPEKTAKKPAPKTKPAPKAKPPQKRKS